MKQFALILTLVLCNPLQTHLSAQTADSLPLGWDLYGSWLSLSAFRVDRDGQTRHGGQWSLRIHSDSATTNIWAGIQQRFSGDDFRGRRMRLSGYVRVANAARGGVLWMRVQGASGSWATGGEYDRPLTGTTGWQHLEIVLDVLPDATLITIGASLTGRGTLWADDLEFAAVDSTVATTGRVMPAGVPPVVPVDLPRAPRNLDFEGPLEIVRRPVLPFERRTAMIPMRDGVRLFTVIVTPRAPSEPLPIILERTPYGAGSMLGSELAADGYIQVTQDIRGRNRSEGTFVMNRPARDSRDSTSVDETTDAYDTVEWLIHNIPNHNGRVGVMGISYPGWLAEVVLLDPHPAVKAVSPQAPMTDTWLGDDFFHQGAFRQWYALGYSWGLEGEMVDAGSWLPLAPAYDLYEWYLSFGSLKALTDSAGAMRIPTWRRFVEHPAYDSVWQRRAFQRLVTRTSVPTLSVGGWWDSEDLFGSQATYAALERFDTAGVNSVVIGPWAHGQWAQPGGQSLGNLLYGSATADTFRLRFEAPFFAYWLKGQGDGRFPEARLFDAGTNEWRTFDRWPPQDAVVRELYFRADGRLSFEPPTERIGSDDYISDPARPVPYLSRPVERTPMRWSRWMTEDQRFADGRPDVVTWRTAPLEEDMTIAGNVEAHLFASTTGSDADWVVKLIDVYPDSVPSRPEMGGYQLMVAGDILRGRYRRSWEHPEAVLPNTVESYTVDLHQQCYTFRRGHRIMVQVQSTWFPLYDRNPQTWVPNIFEASASAYRVQTHRVYRTSTQPSHVEVMVLPSGSGRQ